MRYYFFKTSMEERDGEMKATLRALPGQAFEDGTTVDTTLNVRSPKEAGSAPGGTRGDYPIGTHFCSTQLRLLDTNVNGKKCAPFYTVYDEDHQMAADNFHPVSDDPDFQYASPKHRSDEMNVAFVKFLAFGTQDGPDKDAPARKKAKRGKAPRRPQPADSNGVATTLDSAWKPLYDDQVDEETGLVAIWMRRLTNDIGIKTMAKKPKVDSNTTGLMQELLASGESVDSITSRSRFNDILKIQKMSVTDLGLITKGPMEWYLGEILDEHRTHCQCTARPRNAGDSVETEDAAFIINTRMNSNFGTSNPYDNGDTIKDLTKALKDGWTVDDILVPEVFSQRQDIETLAAALASGSIPAPNHADGDTLIGQLLKNPRNRKPADSEGFHIEDRVWKVLLCNLHRRRHTALVGPTGTGKTEIVRMLCERTGTPFTIIPMGAITDPTEQLVGKMDLDPATQGTKFDWADFALAVQRPGVVLLDELNRCPRNGNNILFSLLDGTRTLVAPGAKSGDQRVIKLNPDCVFFATANIGDEYVNTQPLDAAIKTRFMFVELGYLDTKTEAGILVKRTGIDFDDAFNIAFVANNIRNDHRNMKLESSVSMRESLYCASLVADGFPVEEACELVMLPLFEAGVSDNDANSERGKVRAILSARFSNRT